MGSKEAATAQMLTALLSLRIVNSTSTPGSSRQDSNFDMYAATGRRLRNAFAVGAGLP